MVRHRKDSSVFNYQGIHVGSKSVSIRRER